MPLRAALATAKDLLEKLKRDRELLEEEVTSDRFFNFVVTAYSLCDWITNDPNVPPAAKKALSSFRQQRDLLVCRDVANANKHFALDAPNQKKAKTDRVESEAGYGIGRFGVGGYSEGEEQITITLTDATAFGALEFAKNVVDAWEGFFAQHQV